MRQGSKKGEALEEGREVFLGKQIQRSHHRIQECSPDRPERFKKDNPKSFMGHHFLGLAHLGNRDIQQGKTALAEAVKLNPNWIEGRLLIADIHLRTGALDLELIRK